MGLIASPLTRTLCSWGEGWAAGFAEELADGFEDLRRVLGDEADGFAVDEDFVFVEDGLDGEILSGREADELGDFEIGGAEAVEESEEAIGVAAGDGEMGAAERPPGWGDGPVELFVVNAAEETDYGRTGCLDRNELVWL